VTGDRSWFPLQLWYQCWYRRSLWSYSSMTVIDKKNANISWVSGVELFHMKIAPIKDYWMLEKCIRLQYRYLHAVNSTHMWTCRRSREMTQMGFRIITKIRTRIIINLQFHSPTRDTTYLTRLLAEKDDWDEDWAPSSLRYRQGKAQKRVKRVRLASTVRTRQRRAELGLEQPVHEAFVAPEEVVQRFRGQYLVCSARRALKQERNFKEGFKTLSLNVWDKKCFIVHPVVLQSQHDSEKVRWIILNYPPITCYWTVPLILDHSYLVGK
jgi:hypothetical protein